KEERLAPAGEPVVVNASNSQPRPIPVEMPWLGGPVIAEQRIEGKRVLCGARGVVIVDGPIAGAPLAGVFAVRETGTLIGKAAAEKMEHPGWTPGDLAPRLRDANPFIHLRALEAIVQIHRGEAGWARILASTPDDPLLAVRRLAVQVIVRSAAPEWKSFLERG